MTKENHYTTAVNNFERLVDFCEERLSPDQVAILRYNVFFLKMMPEYQRVEPPKIH